MFALLVFRREERDRPRQHHAASADRDAALADRGDSAPANDGGRHRLHRQLVARVRFGPRGAPAAVHVGARPDPCRPRQVHGLWARQRGSGGARDRAGDDSTRSRDHRPDLVQRRRSHRHAVCSTSSARRRLERNGNNFDYTVEWACGVDPLDADFSLPGHELASITMTGTRDSRRPARAARHDQRRGRVPVRRPHAAAHRRGRLRRELRDHACACAWKTRSATMRRRGRTCSSTTTRRCGRAFLVTSARSGESSPILADLDGDGHDEIVMGTATGEVHAIRDDGTELPGWPVATNLLPLHGAADAYQPAALGTNWHTSIIAPVAVGDIDDDGSSEVVVADTNGAVYVFADDGTPRAGFPVDARSRVLGVRAPRRGEPSRRPHPRRADARPTSTATDCSRSSSPRAIDISTCGVRMDRINPASRSWWSIATACRASIP